MVDSVFLCYLCRCFLGWTNFINAVGLFLIDSSGIWCWAWRTSAGLYYFAAKLAPPEYSALSGWITGWANVTGQIALVCSIDFTWYAINHLRLALVLTLSSAQMFATAISVGTDGTVNLGPAPMYGILIALLLSHAIVCSAATQIIARLSLVFAVVNGKSMLQASKLFTYQLSPSEHCNCSSCFLNCRVWG